MPNSIIPYIFYFSSSKTKINMFRSDFKDLSARNGIAAAAHLLQFKNNAISPLTN